MKKISKQEMQHVTGGAGDIWDLLQQAWDNTPEGGSSHWVNRGDGCFDGSICCPFCDEPFPGVICY